MDYYAITLKEFNLYVWGNVYEFQSILNSILSYFCESKRQNRQISGYLLVWPSEKCAEGYTADSSGGCLLMVERESIWELPLINVWIAHLEQDCTAFVT